jgi:DNA methylase
VTSGARQNIREDNKLRPEDRPAHDWYRFVLSFPPHLVRDYIARFDLNSNHRVLDPFCGTGTTLVECKKLGISSVGTESNPMPCFASRVKVTWEVNPDGLLSHAQEVAGRAEERLNFEGSGADSDLPLFRKNGKHSRLRSLPTEVGKLLLKDSISPAPLHKT